MNYLIKMAHLEWNRSIAKNEFEVNPLVPGVH